MNEFTVSALSLIGIGFAAGYAIGFMRGWHDAHKKIGELIQQLMRDFRRELSGK